MFLCLYVFLATEVVWGSRDGSLSVSVSQSFHHFCSSLKYLFSYWMDCHHNVCIYGFEWIVSTTLDGLL